MGVAEFPAHWPSDPAMRDVLLRLRDSGAPAVREGSVGQTRARIREMRRAMPSGPELGRVDSVVVPSRQGDVSVRCYVPADAGAGSIVYAHGGGWVLGGIDESDALCRHLALHTGHEVISVGYRLAPEHVFPAALDDVEAVVGWATNVHRPSEAVVVMGDSAGANLVTVVARRARDGGDSAIVLQVLVYPVTDAEMRTDSFQRFEVDGLLLGSADMRWFWDQYVPDSGDRLSPDASPARAEDLAGLPPAVIVVAGYDPLRDEAVSYAERLSSAGVAVTLYEYPQMIHGFFPMYAEVDQAADAMRLVVERVRDAL